MNLTVCPPRGPSISRDFFLAEHTLPTRPESAGQKIAQPPSMTSHNLWTVRKKAEVQLWTDND